MSKLVEKYVGKKFGSLLVVAFSHKKGKGNYFQCKCDCGNTPTIRISCLSSGQQKKCRQCYKGSNHPCWRGVGEISKDLFNTIHWSAKDRNLEFDVDLDYLWKLFLKQKRKCALTGIPLAFAVKYSEKVNTSASLDRIDSTKGYVKGNVRWVHKSINHVKCNIPDDLFFFICERVGQLHPNTISEDNFVNRCRTIIKNV